MIKKKKTEIEQNTSANVTLCVIKFHMKRYVLFKSKFKDIDNNTYIVAIMK